MQRMVSMPNCSIKKAARGTEPQSEPRRVCRCQVPFPRGTMVLVAGDLRSLFLGGGGEPLVRRSVPSATHTGIKDKPAFPGILLPRRSTGMKEPVFPPPGKRSYTKESPETRAVPSGCGGGVGERATSRWAVGELVRDQDLSSKY